MEKAKTQTSREKILANLEIPTPTGAKKWSLEDDEDEEAMASEASKAAKQEEEEEEDPLDAFMNEVNKEVKKLKGGVKTALGKPKSGIVTGVKSEAKDLKKPSGIVIMTGVAKKKTEAASKRGELIEQNQAYTNQSASQPIRTWHHSDLPL